MNDTEVIETTGTVLSASEAETAITVSKPSPVVAADDVDFASAMARLSRFKDAGLIVPIASPVELREVFKLQQQVYAAILGPEDYLYTVSFRGSNKPLLTRDHAYAIEMAKTNNGTVLANPIKGGVTKLAKALGITARRIKSKGLPDEPTARFASVEYEALHESSGRSEIGVGFCDASERNKAHDIMATADTRAYCRAVLRLAGFGDISADEVIAGGSDDPHLPSHLPDGGGMRPVASAPPLDDVNVMAAASVWARAVANREGKPFLAPAQQITQNARELRARARRGDSQAALALGAKGLRWEGAAQDANGIEPFEVGDSPVAPQDVRAAEAPRSAPAQSASKGPATPQSTEAPTVTDKAAQLAREQEALDRLSGAASAATEPRPAPGGEGWDLSSQGSKADDAPAPAAPAADDLKIPEPNLKYEVITHGQAKKLSALVKTLHDQDKDASIAWIKDHMTVSRSTDIRANQYEKAMFALKEAIEKKESK